MKLEHHEDLRPVSAGNELALRPADPLNPKPGAGGPATDGAKGSPASHVERVTRMVKRDLLVWEAIDLAEEMELRHGVRHGQSSIFVGVNGEGGVVDWLSTDDERFRNKFRALCYSRLGRGPVDSVIDEVIANVQGRGIMLPEEPIARRVLERDGKIWVSLGPQSPHVVEITGDGWIITAKAPGLFLAADNAATWPMPVRGGSVDELRPLFPNITDDGWKSMIGFVVSSYLPTGSFPILTIDGPMNSGKSTFLDTVRTLCDPVIGLDARAELPTKPEDLLTIADSHHVLSFDNLSGISKEMSDALCRVTTGAARQCRRLYRQGVLHTLRARNPVILNGITPGVERDDLVSRSVFVELQIIDDAKRIKEVTFRHSLQAALPRALGAIFDAVARALRDYNQTTLRPSHRLEDASAFATAAEPALGYPDGSIVSAWLASQRAIRDKLSGSDPVVSVLDRLMDKTTLWQGSSSLLLQQALALEDGDAPPLPSDFPKTAARLGDYLRRRSDVLVRSGYSVEKSRTGDARLVTIRHATQTPKDAVVEVIRPGATTEGTP